MLLNTQNYRVVKLADNTFVLSIPIAPAGGSFNGADIQQGDTFEFEDNLLTIKTAQDEEIPGIVI